MTKKNVLYVDEYLIQQAQWTENVMRQTYRELLGNITYELLTPITTIRAFAETLQDDMVNDEQTKHAYYREIIGESKRLEQMVIDFAELCKLQHGCSEFRKSLVRSADIFGPVLERFLIHYAGMETKLDIEGLDLDALPFLYTDAEKVIRLMNILLDSSVKLAGREGTVSITNEIAPGGVTICIKANGIGIPGEALKDISDCFCTGDIGCAEVEGAVQFAIAGQIAKGLDEKLWIERLSKIGTAIGFSVTSDRKT